MRYTYRDNFFAKKVRESDKKQGWGDWFEIIEEFDKYEDVYRDDYLDVYKQESYRCVKFKDENGKIGEMSKAVFQSIMRGVEDER